MKRIKSMLFDNVLVSVAKKDKSEGGIILPIDSLNESILEGKVIDCGRERKSEFSGEYHYTKVNVGDMILFKKVNATEIQVGGAQFFVVKDTDIIAIVE